MLLRNNPFGRLQLVLQTLSQAIYQKELAETTGGDMKIDAEEFLYEITRYFKYKEIQRLSADFKDIWNSDSEFFEIHAVKVGADGKPLPRQ